MIILDVKNKCLIKESKKIHLSKLEFKLLLLLSSGYWYSYDDCYRFIYGYDNFYGLLKLKYNLKNKCKLNIKTQKGYRLLDEIYIDKWRAKI